MFHRGTLPDSKNNIYVYDIRLLCFSTPAGFRPLGMYSRRAHAPLSASLASGESSWEQVGTNLSCATATGWKSETERVLYMDRKNFPQLGLGIDDLIEGSAMLFVCVFLPFLVCPFHTKLSLAQIIFPLYVSFLSQFASALYVAYFLILEGFVQTSLCTIAIDKMALRLSKADGTFDYDMFAAMNGDAVLMSELTD